MRRCPRFPARSSPAVTGVLLALAASSPAAERDAEDDAAAGTVAGAAGSAQDDFWRKLQGLCDSVAAAAGELLQAPDEQVSPDAAQRL